jgi:hypothetical protein
MNSTRLLALQLELYSLLRKTPQLKITLGEPWWSDNEFNAIVWVVQDFVNQNNDVIQDADPLIDWLDKYQFFLSTGH